MKPSPAERLEINRAGRHLEILRDLARVVSNDPERVNRPKSSADARLYFKVYLTLLALDAPRSGPGAATGVFIDELIAIAERWEPYLFHCFDDSRIPATTNELEGVFRDGKRLPRRTQGRSSTVGTVAQSLPEDFLLTLAFVRTTPRDELAARLASVSIPEFEKSRHRLNQNAIETTKDRSIQRNLDRHLSGLLKRWSTQDETS